MPVNRRVRRALEGLKHEIYLYEKMLERRLNHGRLKEDQLQELLEEIIKLEEARSFFKEQVIAAPSRTRRLALSLGAFQNGFGAR